MEAFKSRFIYPNPLEPSGVEFILEEDSRVTLRIYDVDGNELETVLEDAALKSGRHAVAIRTENFAEGVYVYRLSTKDSHATVVDTKRWVVRK